MPDDQPPTAAHGENTSCSADALARLKKACDDEFARYEKTRSDITTAERDAEKNYDTLLVTISTLAIGSTFTLLKDAIRPEGGAGVLLWLTWLCLGGCLFIALVDRLLTYQSHTDWRETLDREFNDWKEGAWDRAVAKLPDMRFSKVLPLLKWCGFGTLGAGILFLLLTATASPGKSPSTPAPAPVIVNVYAATTQPTTQS